MSIDFRLTDGGLVAETHVSGSLGAGYMAVPASVQGGRVTFSRRGALYDLGLSDGRLVGNASAAGTTEAIELTPRH